MRKVSASEFVSLDGVVEDPGEAEGSEYGGWSFAYFNEELGQLIGEGFAASDAMLMGGQPTSSRPPSGQTRTRRRIRTPHR